MRPFSSQIRQVRNLKIKLNFHLITHYIFLCLSSHSMLKNKKQLEEIYSTLYTNKKKKKFKFYFHSFLFFTSCFR